ncbi:MAG: NifU family protein [Acidobacteria bacterium]|nr:NifU family protein [Acidobacteriota bacterium]
MDGVTVAGNILTVHKTGTEEWPVVGRKIGAIIRERLQAGGTLISDKHKQPPIAPEKLKAKVQEVLDTSINPAVASHGGYIEILDIIENNVYLRMGGGCQGCGAASVTLKQGVEGLIRERIPEVANIYDTTDHAAGTNPYYAPAK